MKRIISFALVLVLFIGLIPTGILGAFAADGTEKLYVGGVRMYDGDYLAVGAASTVKTKPSTGYAYYKNGTLTLHNYEYSGYGYLPEGAHQNIHTTYVIIYCTADLDMVLEGENKLSYFGELAVSGIGVEGFFEIKEGTGTLTINVNDYGITSGGSLTVSGNTLNVSSGFVSLYSWADVILSNSNVTLASEDVGVYAWSSVAISGGNTDITSGDVAIQAESQVDISGDLYIMASTWGIYAADDNVNIEKGTFDITAEFGIQASKGDINIKGDSITITSKRDSVLALEGDINITGGTLTLSTDEEAISAQAALSISNSTVNIEKSLNGIYTESGKLSITNSVVDVNSESDCICSYGESVVVTNSDLTLSAGREGIYSMERGITVNGGSLNISSQETGIHGGGNMTLNGVTANIAAGLNGEMGGYVIYARDGDVTVGGTLIATGESGIGVSDGDVIVNANKVEITSSTVGMTSFDGNIHIANGNVTVSAKTWGLTADFDIRISDGNVNITASTDAIVSDSGRIAIDGGYVSAKTLQPLYSAMNSHSVSINATLPILASESADGPLGDYVASNHDNYDWIVVGTIGSTDEPSDTPVDDDILYGDANGDGVVNSIDAAQVLKHDAYMITLSGNAYTAAEVTGDGSVNSIDAAQILKLDAFLINSFPVE